MTLKGRRVVIQRTPAAERIGTIWIPERAQRATLEGEVRMIGDKVQTLEIGQRVLFPSRAWSPFPVLDDSHVLVWERDVLCVLEDAGLGVLS